MPYPTLEYTARCPGGDHDATWIAQKVDMHVEGTWCYLSKIISIECGVCDARQ